MPVYLGKDVSDDYLQGLIASYKDGRGDHADDSDSPIIAALEADLVVSESHARTLGKLDACEAGEDEDDTEA